MAPGSLWLEHTMSFSVMSTQICSDNVKAFRSFGQLRFAASSGLHSRDDTAPCVSLFFSSISADTQSASLRYTFLVPHRSACIFFCQSCSFWLLISLLDHKLFMLLLLLCYCISFKTHTFSSCILFTGFLLSLQDTLHARFEPASTLFSTAPLQQSSIYFQTWKSSTNKI